MWLQIIAFYFTWNRAALCSSQANVLTGKKTNRLFIKSRVCRSHGHFSLWCFLLFSSSHTGVLWWETSCQSNNLKVEVRGQCQGQSYKASDCLVNSTTCLQHVNNLLLEGIDLLIDQSQQSEWVRGKWGFLLIPLHCLIINTLHSEASLWGFVFHCKQNSSARLCRLCVSEVFFVWDDCGSALKVKKQHKNIWSHDLKRLVITFPCGTKICCWLCMC